MRIISRRQRNLKQNRQGLSNIIIVVLSLVILVVIASNVVLWSYQMNQLDWERVNENVRIDGVVRVTNSSWFVAQSEYTVNAGSRVSGTHEDTQTIDTSYERFREAANWWDSNYNYRKQLSVSNNVASTIGSGYSIVLTVNTTSLVSESKMLSNGNDLRIVYLNGSSWIQIDRDIINMNTTFTQVWFKTQADIGSPPSTDNNYYLYYGNPSAGSPPANRSNVYLWYDDFNRADNPDITTETVYSKTQGGAWSIDGNRLKNIGAAGDPNKLIVDALGIVTRDVDMFIKLNVSYWAGNMDLGRMGLSSNMDYSGGRGSGYNGLFHQDRNSLDLLNDLRSWGTLGTYSWATNTWYYMRFRVIEPNLRLGKVRVWPATTTEPGTWTVNGNFGSGAARGYGEVGISGSRQPDITFFDDFLIRYIIDPEPSVSAGSEEQFTALNYRLDINSVFAIDLSTYLLANIKTVEIQLRYRANLADENWHLKAYNWTAAAYSDSGFNNKLGHAPTTGWDIYAVNVTDKWRSYISDSGTIYIKLQDNQADANQTTIDIDFLGVRAKIDGTNFTFKNQGSMTSHMVSLWVINSTNHRRYDLDIFVNSAETFSYIRADISLPSGQYFVKVITERGNTAIYSAG